MKYKLLEEQDLKLMSEFIDDENTNYDINNLKEFINNKNNYGFIAKIDEKIIGFAFGYVLLKPDGKKVFYLHAIDIMQKYQSKGYGTKLMQYIFSYVKTLDCYKMFLITNKSNKPACKCYENTGGINKYNDDVVYMWRNNNNDNK